MFQPLSKKEIKEIIKLQLNGLNALLEEQGIRAHFRNMLWICWENWVMIHIWCQTIEEGDSKENSE